MVPNVLVGRMVVERLKSLPHILYSNVMTADGQVVASYKRGVQSECTRAGGPKAMVLEWL